MQYLIFAINLLVKMQKNQEHTNIHFTLIDLEIFAASSMNLQSKYIGHFNVVLENFETKATYIGQYY